MSFPAAIALCSNLARSLVVAASKNSVSSGSFSAASRFVVQRAMTCALASCASLSSLRPTSIGSGITVSALRNLQCYTLLSAELGADDSEGACGIIEARRVPVRHARERSRRRKTARLQECKHVRLRIGKIDEERCVDALDRVRHDGAGDRIA